MTVYEFLTMFEGPLKTMATSGISIGDAKNLAIYREYTRMKLMGHKISYIVAYLQDKYGCSDRWIYMIVKKFEQEIKMR